MYTSESTVATSNKKTARIRKNKNIEITLGYCARHFVCVISWAVQINH